MEIDLTQELIGLNGKPLQAQDRDDEDKPVTVNLTLRKAIVEALMAAFKDEDNLSGADKVKRYKMAQKIQDAERMMFSAEDLSLIKKLVAKLYSTLVVGIVWEILDTETKAVKLEEASA